MSGDKHNGVWKPEPRDYGTPAEKLDRALVTGLMLEVILEASSLPVAPKNFDHLVKTRLKDRLADNLAGRVTLDRFRHLLSQVDIWFPVYYPLTAAGASRTTGAKTVAAMPAPAAAAAPSGGVLRVARLKAWLQEEGRGLLPHRPHRKVNPERLWEFLARTRGGWFRLLDVTSHFGVDRKTAWEYLQKLLHAGLLRHNRARSAAVRYAVASRFLVVRADVLEPGIEASLSGLTPPLAAPVSAWLIATGGEAFGEKEWHGRLEPARCQQVIARLQSAGILEEVGRVGESRMLRLGRQWLRE